MRDLIIFNPKERDFTYDIIVSLECLLLIDAPSQKEFMEFNFTNYICPKCNYFNSNSFLYRRCLEKPEICCHRCHRYFDVKNNKNDSTNPKMEDV